MEDFIGAAAAGTPPAHAGTLSPAAAGAQTVSELIEAAAQAHRMMGMFAGLRAQLLDQAKQLERAQATRSKNLFLGERSLRAEVACALKIPERTAENLLGEAGVLVSDLPATREALSAGEISYRHAALMVEHTVSLDAATRAAVEQQALPKACGLTAAAFGRRLRVIIEGLHPETMVERHERAVEDREVSYEPAKDGMAWLTAYLPAAECLAGFNRLTEIAKSLQLPGEERTLTQLRADVFRDLLLEGQPATGECGIRPTVFVTVPVMTLLGRSDDPATLDGYGPIDPDTARDLAGHAPSFIRILTQPETGAVLSVGRDSYRVPADLKHWLRTQDRTCRFPGCARDARFCDIDHTIDWDFGGDTRHDNLAHLCKSHHTLKHQTSWRVSNSRDGTLTWTSPGGRDYTTEPEIRMRT